MAFFYTDSGSFNRLEVSGSTILSGSLIVSGTTNFGPSGLTGSLFGTASFATTAVTAVTASYFSGSVSFPDGAEFTSVTASAMQLLGTTDTTATNKILVLNTATNKIFTTASILPSGLISSSQQFNSLTAPFTGSFTGSFTGALTHFNPSTLKLTVGTTAPASPSVNDLWVDTN